MHAQGVRRGDVRVLRQALTGAKEQRPRWKRCVDATDSDLGEALGKVYVERTFGAEGKERTLRMVQAIEAALDTDIKEISWMSDETKKQAAVKLRAVANKIGYPDRWRDYSSLQIVRGDALGNSLRANTFAYRRQLAKIGKPVDKTEWLMTPPTVNAYYNPFENNINFPAGILQPPFFIKAADDAVNFGAAGAVVGPRADPRLRRPGPPLRRRRQPARLVDAGRRQGVRGARDLRRQSVLAATPPSRT